MLLAYSDALVVVVFSYRVNYYAFCLYFIKNLVSKCTFDDLSKLFSLDDRYALSNAWKM